MADTHMPVGTVEETVQQGEQGQMPFPEAFASLVSEILRAPEQVSEDEVDSIEFVTSSGLILKRDK